jgi:uncharacterized protein (TIGR02453 family)
MDRKGILRFLADLKKSNNRDWFQKNKDRYLDAKNSFDDFLEGLHKELLKFDSGLADVDPRKIAFRIYRDVRFSKDKRPYKVNMGAGFSPGGKMLQEAGYYVHLEPGGCFVAGGLYQPSPENLARVRQEIDYTPDELLRILRDRKFKAAFKGLDDFDRVKTAPKGYAKDHPHIDLLKNKSFIVSHNFRNSEVTSPAFVKAVAATCRLIKPLNDYLNGAIR